MSSEDDDSNSTDAIVMERSSSCHSLRSMPLQKDDDYFYYHGDGGTEDDEDGDGETVDHIGLLIGPAIVQNRTTNMERDFRDSLRSMTSEVTSDWNDNDAGSQDELHSTTQECIGLKLQIADLKAQLDDQKFHYREKYNAIISSLQDRNLSLECENVVLKQKLQESEDAALRERVEARRFERLLQGMFIPACSPFRFLVSSSSNDVMFWFLQIRSNLWQGKCSYLRTESTTIKL